MSDDSIAGVVGISHSQFSGTSRPSSLPVRRIILPNTCSSTEYLVCASLGRTERIVFSDGHLKSSTLRLRRRVLVFKGQAPGTYHALTATAVHSALTPLSSQFEFRCLALNRQSAWKRRRDGNRGTSSSNTNGPTFEWMKPRLLL